MSLWLPILMPYIPAEKVFSELACDEKTKKALRHKVKAVEWTYNTSKNSLLQEKR